MDQPGRALVASRDGRRHHARAREARPGGRDPPGAGRRPLADARPRDLAHERSVPRPDRGHVLRLDGRLPRLGDRRADRDRRPLRRAERRADRRLRRGDRLRREHPPRSARDDRAPRPAVDRAQLLGERSRRGRAHARALARARERRSPARRTPTGSSRRRPIVNALRGRKSAEEVARIRAAARETEEIFDVVTRHCARA